MDDDQITGLINRWSRIGGQAANLRTVQTPVSPRRINYYDSPEAPKASSPVPAVNMVVVNDAGETC